MAEVESAHCLDGTTTKRKEHMMPPEEKNEKADQKYMQPFEDEDWDGELLGFCLECKSSAGFRNIHGCDKSYLNWLCVHMFIYCDHTG